MPSGWVSRASATRHEISPRRRCCAATSAGTRWGGSIVGGDFYDKDFRIEPAWAPRNEGAYVQAYLVVNDGADPDFPLFQLDVTTGVDGGTGFALAPYLPGREDQVVDFDGTRARFERFDDGGKLTWEYADGVFVTFWLSDVTQLQLGPGERVSARSIMATARNSVEELSEDEWRQTAVLPPGGGCQTFSC